MRPTFQLTLEAQHRDEDPQGVLRLRRVLKLLLRSFAFRCLRIDYPEQQPRAAKQSVLFDGAKKGNGT